MKGFFNQSGRNDFQATRKGFSAGITQLLDEDGKPEISLMLSGFVAYCHLSL
jgi:hypothetical protein